MNGHFTDYDSYGFVTYEGGYVDSVKNGCGVSYYHKSSKKNHSGLWKYNCTNGYGRSFYENGSLKFTGFFLDGDIIYGKEYAENDFDLSNKLPKNTAEIFLQMPYHDNEINILNIQWKKDLFEKVEQGDVLFEFEIDKATMSFESHFSGILIHKVIGPSKIGDLLAIIGNSEFDVQGYLIMLNELEDQIIYEGDFVDEEWNGKGKLIYDDGGVYEGDFVDGLRNGRGILTQADGGVYEGDFINGAIIGKGKYTYPDGGGVYEGDFVHAELTGKGKRTYSDGCIFEGDFVDGVRAGYGKHKQLDGTYIGNFINGILEGHALFIDNDGKEHVGKAEGGSFVIINEEHKDVDDPANIRE
jgi:hypothetical protein